MKTYLSHRDGCVDEVVLLSDLSAHILKLKEVVEGMRVGLVTGHRQPCVCIDCIQHSAIDEALRLIGEVCGD